jgi:hypothetical protein
MSQIQGALIHLFNKHRIVFWYDSKHELRGEYEGLILPGVEMVELRNNEFGIKHRLLREHPEQKFLVYHDGPKPPELENWLLDVELAHAEFRADQNALWLNEMGLSPEFLDLVQAHSQFFNAPDRRAALKTLLIREDNQLSLRIKMLAICTDSEPRLDEIIEALLADLAVDKEDKIQLIQECELDSFLWERCARAFGYNAQAPSLQDFAIELFKSCYALGLGAQPNSPRATFNADALVFLKRWKDSIRHHPAFETLSARYADLLNIEQDLQQRDIKALADLDLFRLIDQKILSDLARSVAGRTISAEDCSAIIRQRRRLHWFKDFHHLYDAVETAAQFIAVLDQSTLSMATLAEGVQRYAQTWQRLDQLYRKVIYHTRKAGQVALLETLVNQVENLYTNNYLLKLNNNWQQVVDSTTPENGWNSTPWNITLPPGGHLPGTSPLPGTGLFNRGATAIFPQRRFFEHWVEPFLFNHKKVYVIISDGLRYEIAEELLSIIRREDRYEGLLEPMLSTLPSYTQLGMAALLPNQIITLAENDSGAVNVDGINSQGTANRDKILKQAVETIHHSHATALRAEDVLSMSREDSRALFRDNDVVYVYHNRIDSVGDKRESEERVFEAVEETLEELVTLIKKITAANATNIIITADHGFIYQNRALDESDFSSAEVSGRTVYFQERRFVLGKGLRDQPGLRKFTAAEVGLQGEVEIQIPKSIGRLRLRGSGSRYVHGGAALQEVVVPVLSINKKRESDISKVEVDILRGQASIITTGQFTVALYQVEPVSEKVKARTLRAGIYTLAGKLISDLHELVFDLTAENPRQRETQVRFILTQEANQANNQEVVLKLEEQVPGTSHYTEYKSTRYTMRRSFTSDFEF